MPLNKEIKLNTLDLVLDMKNKTKHPNSGELCSLCNDRDETIIHMMIEYSKQSQKEYQTRQNWMGEVIYRELWKKLKFDDTTKWYMHKQESDQENETH